MTRSIQLLCLIMSILAACQFSNNTTSLETKIEQIISNKKAIVGVSIIGNSGKDTLSINGDRHFPMQSVFKFHIALAVLSEIDKGNFSLDQKIILRKEQLLPEDFWSPLRDENPDGGSFTLAKLMQYAVSQSDNSACDVLINLLGTPKNIEAYFKKKHIQDIEISFNEQEMQAKWDNMFQNWTSPKAASQTLKMFFDNKDGLLSKNSYEFIWKTMKETSTGQNRLRGLLPQKTVVAHKTGWSGTNKETGIIDAVNDIGIIFLPNGKYFIISVFVTNSKESIENNEKIIADIAKVAYDHYSSENK